MVGTIYKYFLDQLRSIDSLTHLIWGFRVHNKLQPITWDLSSIVLKKAFDIYTNRDDLHFLDMGCGQVALLGQYFKKTHSSAIVTSVDIYEDMVACAKENITCNEFDINVIQSDLFSNIQGTYDVIAFNPPYVPSLSVPQHENYPKVGHGGIEGTETIANFLGAVQEYLNPNGMVFLGINCFYVPETKFLELMISFDLQLKKIVRRTCNSSVVYVLCDSN